MPASKRRRAAARAAAETRLPSTPADAAVTDLPDVTVAADAADEVASSRPSRWRRPRPTPAASETPESTDATPLPRGRRARTPAATTDAPIPTKAAAPARGPRARPSAPRATDLRPWGRLALLVLVSLVLAVELLIGLVTHFIYHPKRLILVDVFFFNAVLALPAALLLAPVVKRLMHQPRHLRLLESLSIGLVYALSVTLITLTFLHPSNLPANATPDQLIDSLRNGDVPGIVLADVVAVIVAVQLYPGLNRLVTAPGRRARERMEARGGQATPRKRADNDPRPGRGRSS